MGIFPLPIEPDSSLRLRVQSSKTNRIVLDALVQRGRRPPELIELINVTPDGDRLVDAKEEPIPGDKLWGLTIREPTGTLERGQTFVRGDLIGPQGGSTVQVLAGGYVHGEHVVAGGRIESPLDGKGHLSWRAVAEDIAPVDITEALAATNTLRRVYGFLWYYHASSDAADRTITINHRTPGTALPTGITTGGTTTIHAFPYAGAMTLSADQEGMIYVNDNFAMSADNSSRTFENVSIKPTGFPVWIHKNDLAELLFNVTLAEAADRHSIFILQEEWFA